MPIQLKDSNNNMIPVQFLQFSGGERHVQFDADVFDQLDPAISIRADLHSSQDIMDYLLLESILLQRGCLLSVEIPYFPYARQDRICAKGQAFSLEMMTRLMNLNMEYFPQQRRQLTVWDAHSQVTEQLLQQNSFFQQICHVSASEIILNSPELTKILMRRDTVLICPDAGAKNRTQHLAHAIRLQRITPIEIVMCEKKRHPNTGKISHTEVHAEDLSLNTAVICDDICDGGATFIGIAKALRERGCQRIIVYVTHGMFSKGLEVFEGYIDEIFTSNSFPQNTHPKLNMIDFA